MRWLESKYLHIDTDGNIFHSWNSCIKDEALYQSLGMPSDVFRTTSAAKPASQVKPTTTITTKQPNSFPPKHVGPTTPASPSQDHPTAPPPSIPTPCHNHHQPPSPPRLVLVLVLDKTPAQTNRARKTRPLQPSIPQRPPTAPGTARRVAADVRAHAAGKGRAGTEAVSAHDAARGHVYALVSDEPVDTCVDYFGGWLSPPSLPRVPKESTPEASVH